MYNIRFDCQTEAGIPDYESCSIVLSKEQYEALPELPINTFDENCTFFMREFKEPTRNPSKSFPAIWVSNPNWQLEQPESFEEQYNEPEYNWVLVCIDTQKNFWIAFKFWNAATNAEVMDYSSVGVAYPWHGDVYRLGDILKKVIKLF